MYDPDAQRFRDYAEGRSNDSPVDLSGREGAPRIRTCDDCGVEFLGDDGHVCEPANEPQPATVEDKGDYASDTPFCGSCGRNLNQPKTTDCRWCDVEPAAQPTTPHTATVSEKFYGINDCVRVIRKDDTGSEHDELIAECRGWKWAQRIAEVLNATQGS